MLSGERGTIITKTRVKDATGAIKIEANITKTNAKWDPNNFSLKLLDDTKPLLDNSNTPRAAKKAITLERCFDHDIWIYNKTSLDEFKEAGKDNKRGKLLAKKIRKQKRSRSKSGSRSKSITNRGNSTGGLKK